MSTGRRTLSQHEIELLVRDILANDLTTLDKVRTLAVLRQKGYDDPGTELGRIESEFRTPHNLLIAGRNASGALDRQIEAADLRVTVELSEMRLRRQ